MRVENGAIVMTDAETGKAYTRVLSQMELNWMLAILTPCDGGFVDLKEIAPFIMRSPHISEQEARQRVESAQAQSILGPLIGKSVKVQLTDNYAGDKDGWVEWLGGPRALDREALVDIKFANGHVVRRTPAGNWTWCRHHDPKYSIVAYRVVRP